MPETTLTYAYRHIAFMGRIELCACGGHISSRFDAKAIRYAVAAHNQSPVHAAWRVWREDQE